MSAAKAESDNKTHHQQQQDIPPVAERYVALSSDVPSVAHGAVLHIITSIGVVYGDKRNRRLKELRALRGYPEASYTVRAGDLRKS